jgi:S-(hydroxymethyl)glutathione dehydrogenase / alcohol dehydrogenase
MKAAVLHTLNEPLEVAEVELSDLTFGQVLVKVLVSGICGSQLQEIAGNKGNGKYVPHLLGHEGSGIVEDIGHGVTKVKKGDKVILHWRKGEGIESDFPTYGYKGKQIRSGKVTTFSQYSIVSENRVTPVPTDTPDDLCALLGCGLSTALGTVLDEAKVRPGESILIAGLGGLGACVIKAAHLAGARPIFGIDIYDHKRGVLESLGGDRYINGSTEDVLGVLTELGHGHGIDVIIETSGNARSIAATLPLLASGGRFIMVGQPRPGESVELVNANHLFSGEGKTIKATQGGRFSPTADIPRYLNLHRAGRLTINDLVTHRTSLDKINDAVELMRAGKANRIMIDLWP